MGWGARNVLSLVAALAAALALFGATAAAAGPRYESVPVAAGVFEVVPYGDSRLLLLESSGISRVTADGALDPSFGEGGRVKISGSAVAVDDAGRVLVGSYARRSTTNYETMPTVTRLLPDGRPDPGFGTDGEVRVDFGGRYDSAMAVAVEASGKILVGGDTQNEPESRGRSSAIWAVARLWPGGGIDSSFGRDGVAILGGGGEYGVGRLQLVPTKGGIVGAGLGDWGLQILKLSYSGKLIRGFGGGDTELIGRGRITEYEYREELNWRRKVAVLPSGRILATASGELNTYAPGYDEDDARPPRTLVLALNRDGRVDRSFGKRGWAIVRFGGPTFAGGIAPLRQGAVALAVEARDRRAKRSRIGLVAIGRTGKRVPRFGDKPRLTVSPSAWSTVEDVVTDSGRLLVLAREKAAKSSWLVGVPGLG